jgi:ABC-type branched-subunit amino acid transport system substrate-binding protein
MKISKLLPFVWMLALAASPAFAQVKVGVTVSATGPQASLGVPEVNAIGLLAKDIDQLPDSNPVKKNALGFVKEDEGKFGAGTVSIFAAYSADTGLLLEQAVPVALKKAKPGTVEFRQALRDAIESVHGLATTTGIVNMSPQDHVGVGFDALVMAQIVEGKWRLAK